MVVCRRSSKEAREPRHAASKTSTTNAGRPSRLGEGGPVFLPPRRPSAIAETLLTQTAEAEGVTAYDERWFAGRPST